jgi:CheY-like chemotaxis protein
LSTILIDEESAFRGILRDHLDLEGYNVRTDRDGASGFEQMRADPPDRVLLDVMLTGMDGYEVCSHMRTDPVLARIPVKMPTARATAILDRDGRARPWPLSSPGIPRRAGQSARVWLGGQGKDQRRLGAAHLRRGPECIAGER